jgi:heme/copper-type cytochrome/quinol oxidase subunit 4
LGIDRPAYDFWNTPVRARDGHDRQSDSRRREEESETMASLRSPLALFVGFFVFVSVPLVAMWVAVGDLSLLAPLVGFMLYFVVAHVAIPGWVYLDARSAGNDYAVAWTVFSFFVPFVVALVYVLLIRVRRGTAAEG